MLRNPYTKGPYGACIKTQQCLFVRVSIKMRGSLAALSLLSALTSAKLCPFAGPAFPVPTSLSSASRIQVALEQIQSSFEHALRNGTTGLHGPVSGEDGYSVQIFSAYDEKPLLDWHHTPEGIVGNRTLNGDSIYRIASTTKLFTVYMLLIEAGDGILNDFVTKYIPELAGKGNWDSITVGALAGYTAGVVSESMYHNLVLEQQQPKDPGLITSQYTALKHYSTLR